MKTDIKSHVLIVGTYSGLNKGDRLMQLVTMDALMQCSYIPILSSPFPKIDRALYSKTQVVKSRRRNLPLSIMQCLLLCVMPFKLRIKYAAHNSELIHYKSSKFIIDTSGDMLTEDYGIHVALSHLVPLLYCILLKKKYLILAQSLGPFKKMRFVFKKVLSRAEIISARDQITYDYLHELGLCNLERVADLGFMLPAEHYESINLDNFIHNLNKKVVGICPSALFFEKFSKLPSEDNIKNFCLMLDSVAKKNHLAYVFLPHVMTPSGKMDDDTFCKKLVKKIQADSYVVDKSVTPGEIKNVISRLEAMVSFRMHGSIAALDSLVPTITVSYSHKANGLHEVLGLPEWVVDGDEEMVESLGKKIESILNEALVIRRHLERVVPRVRDMSKQNIELIKRI